MAHDNIAEQTLVEHEMLKHISDGLRRAISWQAEGDDLVRKLSTIRFIAQSLQRHLDHLLALEEYDGYMDAVFTSNPHFHKQVVALRLEHDEFRKGTEHVVHGLENVAPTEQAAFDTVCTELEALLEKLDEHTKKEVRLLQEAFERDGGGEG
jgi:hemerythrin-like domain-containing protein